jgi:hypothetical protein
MGSAADGRIDVDTVPWALAGRRWPNRHRAALLIGLTGCTGGGGMGGHAMTVQAIPTLRLIRTVTG